MRIRNRIPPRQNIIPDHKLNCWYKTLNARRDKKLRDYLLLVLLTGLRLREAATLRWSDVDFEDRVLTVRSERAKNHSEHRLPLSEFLYKMLTQRKRKNSESEYVFQGRSASSHMIDSNHAIRTIAIKSQVNFTVHDLRRTFLTTAETLDVPYFALKKLANHISNKDVTSGYIIVNVRRLRVYMERISEHLVKLCEIDIIDFE